MKLIDNKQVNYVNVNNLTYCSFLFLVIVRRFLDVLILFTVLLFFYYLIILRFFLRLFFGLFEFIIIISSIVRITFHLFLILSSTRSPNHT